MVFSELGAVTGYNLILFQGRDGCPHISDYEVIRHMMAGAAPDIEVHIAPHDVVQPADFWSRVAERPTLMFLYMVRDGVPATARGARISAYQSSKEEQARWFVEAGLPHPLTKMITPDFVAPDPGEWGPFTVLKPNRMALGRGIGLVRTRDVKYRHPKSWPKNSDRFGTNLLAQQFIDTGPLARSYRVFTVLGRPIYAIVSETIDKLAIPDPSGTDSIDIPVAVQSVRRHVELSNDEEVLALALQVHQKFAQFPTLAIDIIREHATGRLFVLEMHPGGGTWHLSSPHGLDYQRNHRLDLYGQFNALGTITRALIDATRTMAK
jgi:hypothetical protein